MRTFHWRLDEATATYLTTHLHRQAHVRALDAARRHAGRLGLRPRCRAQRRAARPSCPRSSTMLAEHWGPYPAPQAGGIFVNGDIPFSLETLHPTDLHRGRRRVDDRARERPPVVGRQRLGQALARHLLQRVPGVVLAMALWLSTTAPTSTTTTAAGVAGTTRLLRLPALRHGSGQRVRLRGRLPQGQLLRPRAAQPDRRRRVLRRRCRRSRPSTPAATCR